MILTKEDLMASGSNGDNNQRIRENNNH